jgi:integrase
MKTLLTDIVVRNAKPPERGQRTVWDISVANFGLRVSQGGTKSWVVMHGVERQLITIGRWPTIGLSDARTEARRILAERVLNKHRPPTIAFEEARGLFLASCKQRCKPRTVQSYTRLLKRHFKFGRKKLDDITPQDVSKRIDRLSATPSEQNHAFVAARAFFRWCVKRQYLVQSPVAGAMPSRSNPRERVLTDDELAAVFRTAKQGDETFSRIVALLCLLGLRRGEAAGLKWEHMDPTERLITLPASQTKNRRPLVLPYGDLGAEVIETIPRVSDDYLFPASKDTARGKATTIFNGWGKAKEQFDRRLENVAPYTLHDLRRTFATNQAALGTPIHVTEKILNHISGTVSGVAAVYNRHAYMDEMRAAIDAWEAKLTRLLKERPAEA